MVTPRAVLAALKRIEAAHLPSHGDTHGAQLARGAAQWPPLSSRAGAPRPRRLLGYPTTLRRGNPRQLCNADLSPFFRQTGNRFAGRCSPVAGSSRKGDVNRAPTKGTF